MINIYNFVVSNTINATILILMVMLLRFIFGKYSHKTYYYLWIFVFIRHILFFNLSFLSYESYSHKIFTKSNTIFNTINTIKKSVTSHSHIGDNFIKINYFYYIWLLVVIILLTFFVFNILKLHNKLRYSFKKIDNIYECENIKVPFTWGIIKPAVYLPFDIDSMTLKYVLLHEKIHIRRMDNLFKAFSLIICIFYWFNPFIWLAFYFFSKDIELSCDEIATSKLSHKEKIDYSKCLYEFCCESSLILNNFSSNDLKARIHHMFTKKKHGIISGIILFVSLGFFALNYVENYAEEYISGCNINSDKTIYCQNDQKSLPKGLAYIFPLSDPMITCDWECFYNHYAIDMTYSDEKSGPVMAVKDGFVSEIGFSDEIGNYIVIKHEDKTSALYGCLDEIKVEVNQKLKQGKIIGSTGKSGNSTGIHLHFAILDKNGNPDNQTLSLLKYILKTPLK